MGAQTGRDGRSVTVPKLISSMFNEFHKTEAVGSVRRIPAPDVADNGAVCTHLWDLDQPLFHGMGLTAASIQRSPPGVGCSPAGCGSDKSGDAHG